MTAAAWEQLHRDPRHRLEYPSEHVVRFLAGIAEAPCSALDIGCGAGRHMGVMMDRGLNAHGVDVVDAARFGRRVTVGSMTALPYDDETFELAVAFGVFYYGTRADHRQAVAEMHRVLKPGGRAFVCVRTARDWRAGFTRDGVFRYPGEPEDGMQMDFVTEYETRVMYAAFATCEVDETMTTRRSRGWDSDWLITLQK